MQSCKDSTLAAIAEKSLKEVNYHRRWSGEWVIRLGDGTDESHQRMKNAIEQLWPYTGELFQAADFQREAVKSGILINPSEYLNPWINRITAAFDQAGLQVPVSQPFQKGGKQGIHTEQLGYLLAEMQYLQRSYPGAEW